jgi:hypothetical protein
LALSLEGLVPPIERGVQGANGRHAAPS